MKRLLIAASIAFVAIGSPAQTRLASDFEIEKMRKQIVDSPDFLSQLSARLNLGDLLRSRAETAAANEEYERALALAMRQRIETREDADLSAYSTATAYAALAHAKLGRGAEAFEMLEEATRYASSSPKTWNLYATAMSLLGREPKAIAAARNAVAIAQDEVRRQASVANTLDLAIYEYTLASTLARNGDGDEAAEILRRVIARLDGAAFESLRRHIERSESFEIYSTARGEADAYLALGNRATLRLAELSEKRGDIATARAMYERVLARRTDDPTALAALARLGRSDERARWFAAAFDANPFSRDLIRSYREFLADAAAPAIEGASAGTRMRNLLAAMHRRDWRSARDVLRGLESQFPGNATLAELRRELEPNAIPSFLESGALQAERNAVELRRLVELFASDRATAKHRAALDALTLTNIATFDRADWSVNGQTTFASGAIGDIRFRLAQPTAFLGTFDDRTPLRLVYRVLGVTAIDGTDALLIEPIRLEVAR